MPYGRFSWLSLIFVTKLLNFWKNAVVLVGFIVGG
jgi:hypothetical protein